MYRAMPAHTRLTTAPVRWSGCTHERPVSTRLARSGARLRRSNSVSEYSIPAAACRSGGNIR
jgi:hypothetical protein